MELIQNSLFVREGKKWKQRWAVLKQASPDKVKVKDADHYLFLYKDASHAKEGKEKYVISLVHFCGMDVLNEFDKAENILVLITLSQTLFLSFDIIALRERWYKILFDHFGRTVSYNISIPDKQKLKAGQATIRLYPSFFSIITCKNFKCLNRWCTKDIYQYHAVDDSQFLFEIMSPKGRGQVINLLVPNNAHEIAQAFDYNSVQSPTVTGNLQHDAYHGSAILDELDQAKRHAGDQNFFTRAFLRASNRIKKKKKDRHNFHSKKKHSQLSPEESKFQSLERRKSPDLSVHLDEKSLFKTMQIAQQSSKPSSSNKIEDTAPMLPTKKHTSNQQVLNEVDGDRKPRSLTSSDVNIVNNQTRSKNKKSKSAETLPYRDNFNTKKEKGLLLSSAKNTTDIQPTRYQKKSIDSAFAPTYKTPAKHAIEKTRRSSHKSKSTSHNTPTPPPRSPISLGLEPDGSEPSKFKFPSLEKICDNEKEERTTLQDCNGNSNKVESAGDDLSDDAFIANTVDVIPPSIPYNNINNNNGPTNDNYLNTAMFIHRRALNRSKHLSDPLSCENWAENTGDGIVLSSLPQIHPVVPTDYINVRGTTNVQSDDDNDSYVNVKSGQLNNKQKKKPGPLRLMSYRNEFEKYDDEDSSIYHPVGALDQDGNSHSADSVNFRNQSNGSYENIDATGVSASKRSEYLNLMSPPKKNLNYIMIGKVDTSPGMYTSKSTSVSPVRKCQRSPLEVYNKSDYTRIDESATGALNRSMLEHRQARDKYLQQTRQSKMSR